ncbi:MAG: hypothetical protein M3Q65_26575 [Chloroflexota bacterium]|nr:hypothetical protein [Chloroflexota bacterium]
MKPRADRPLAPAALYALIDGRPTRRREIRTPGHWRDRDSADYRAAHQLAPAARPDASGRQGPATYFSTS